MENAQACLSRRLILTTFSLFILGGVFLLPHEVSAQLVYPSSGSVTQTWYDHASNNRALDIANSSGTDIHAAYGGTVNTALKWSTSYGWHLRITHPSSYETLYAHNSNFVVSKGQAVSQKQHIADMGSTGNSTGPHCHFEVRRSGSFIYIPGDRGDWITRDAPIPYTYSGLSVVNSKKGPSMFYETAPGSMSIHRWRSTGTAFSTLTQTGIASGYSLSQVGQHMVSSDVNGDGDDDNVVAYQYPDGTMRLHVFSHGSSYQGSGGWFQSGQFNMANVNGRMVGGDFDGNGKGDVAMLYDLGGGVRALRFLSNGSSFSYDYQDIPSGYSMSQVNDNIAASDVNNDGRDDIVVAYQYSDGTMRLHLFMSGYSYAGSGGWFQSGPFDMAMVNGRIAGGDFNGDGRGDVQMLYKTGSGSLKCFRFLSTGSSFNYDSSTLSSGYDLNLVGKHMAAGDVDGDGDSDVVTAYQYPDGTFRYHIFKNGNSYAGATGWYTSGPFNLANVAGRMTMGMWE